MPRDDRPEQHEERLPPDWPERAPGAFGADRERMLSDVRDVQFPIVLRGYDREAVDQYLVQVNQTIAELESTRSPESAVKRALERVGEETSGILQRANETAEEIASRSRSQADDRLQQAEREARGLLDDAQARVRELEAELEGLSRERDRVIEDIRAAAQELLEVADAVAARGAPEPAEGEEVEEPASEVEDTRQMEAVTEDAGSVRPEEPEPDESVPGHPDLEPEPPDRESAEEGIVRVEPMRGNDGDGQPQESGERSAEPPSGRS
jgi:cell division initiation protein